MIDKGFYINIQDEEKLIEFKGTHVYSEYLKSIHNSPAFSTIIREHIQNVDIKKEINILKADGKLPDTLKSTTLSDLFKSTLTYLAIRIMADSIILKELEDKKVDDVINDMAKDQTVTYVLGLANPEYYKRAEIGVKSGKIGKNTATYKGLVNYLKINGSTTESLTEIEEPKKLKKKTPIITKEDLSFKMDIDDDDIRL